ncbi:MAG: S-methyl-5'-thioadenosine phosphorylase [Polyangia bacterium]
MSEQTTIAVIGGSGLYELEGLTDVEQHTVDTPFGEPSGPIVSGVLGGTRLLFLARHGIGHRLTPSEVNYRANIYALKVLGAERVVSVSAVGSLREEIRPGDLVIVDQYVDRTRNRPSTFFGGGIVAHVMFADPTCPELADAVHGASRGIDARVHRGGSLVVMEGPAFSTRSESHMHRQLGADLIGMTAMPEAKLAREAELCYVTLALTTDYDCWHESEDDVSVEAVIENLKRNVHNAGSVLRRLAESGMPAARGCACATALTDAIITDPGVIPGEARRRLAPIIGRVL